MCVNFFIVNSNFPSMSCMHSLYHVLLFNEPWLLDKTIALFDNIKVQVTGWTLSFQGPYNFK